MRTSPRRKGRWSTGYFDYADLASRDDARLNLREYLADPSPLVDGLDLSREEIAKVTMDANAAHDAPGRVPTSERARDAGGTDRRSSQLASGRSVKGLSVIHGDRTDRYRHWRTMRSGRVCAVTEAAQRRLLLCESAQRDMCASLADALVHR